MVLDETINLKTSLPIKFTFKNKKKRKTKTNQDLANKDRPLSPSGLRLRSPSKKERKRRIKKELEEAKKKIKELKKRKKKKKVGTLDPPCRNTSLTKCYTPTSILKKTCSLFRAKSKRLEEKKILRKQKVSFSQKAEIFKYRHNVTHQVGVDTGFNPGYFMPKHFQKVKKKKKKRKKYATLIE